MAKRKNTRRGNGEGTIYKRADGTWAGAVTIGIKPNGKPDRPFRYGKTRAEVAEKLRILQNQKAAGSVPNAGRLTVGEWVMFYLENYVKPNVSDTTYGSYENLTKNHIIPKLGSKALKKLTTSHIQVCYRELGENGSHAKHRDEETGEMVLTGGGLSAATIARIHNILNPALRQAKVEGKIDKNPAESAKTPKIEKKEMEVMTCEEVATFLQAVGNYRYYPAYYFALSSGARRGEVIGLPWACVDIGVPWATLDKKIPWKKVYALPAWDIDALKALLEEAGVSTAQSGLVYIRQQLTIVNDKPVLKETMKTANSERALEIPAETVLTLIFWRGYQIREKRAYEKANPGNIYNPDGLVFCTKNGNWVPPRSFTRNFQNALKHAGLKPIRFHDTRHTVATLLLEDGKALNTVAEVLGHSDPGFTSKRYGHVTRRMRSEATATMGAVLAAGKPKSKNKVDD